MAEKSQGFHINENVRKCANIEEVIAFCNEMQEKRDTLDYEIDGVVVKINSTNLQDEFGATTKAPRWAIAYKYPAMQATTQLEEINIQVGQNRRAHAGCVFKAGFARRNDRFARDLCITKTKSSV